MAKGSRLFLPFHEPPPHPVPLPIRWGEGGRRPGEGRFMVPMHAEKRKGAFHEPTHPWHLPGGELGKRARHWLPSSGGLGVGSWLRFASEFCRCSLPMNRGGARLRRALILIVILLGLGSWRLRVRLRLRLGRNHSALIQWQWGRGEGECPSNFFSPWIARAGCSAATAPLR